MWDTSEIHVHPIKIGSVTKQADRIMGAMNAEYIRLAEHGSDTLLEITSRTKDILALSRQNIS